MHNHSYESFAFEIHNKIARELVRVAKLLLSYVTPKGYGAWLTDEGKPIYVDYEAHQESLMENLGTGEYKEAYEQGWIRVRFGDYLRFVVGKKSKALDALEDLIYFGKFKGFECESAFNRSAYTFLENPEEAMEFARKYSR